MSYWILFEQHTFDYVYVYMQRITACTIEIRIIHHGTSPKSQRRVYAKIHQTMSRYNREQKPGSKSSVHPCCRLCLRSEPQDERHNEFIRLVEVWYNSVFSHVNVVVHFVCDAFMVAYQLRSPNGYKIRHELVHHTIWFMLGRTCRHKKIISNLLRYIKTNSPSKVCLHVKTVDITSRSLQRILYIWSNVQTPHHVCLLQLHI